jgi:hypothetical protein
LLQQLTARRSEISDDINTLYQDRIKKQTRPSLADYSRLLQSEIRNFSRVFIVIDALDECSENDGIREGFLGEVRKLLPNICLLVTSRPIANLEHEFENATHLEIHASDEDIKRYLEAQIERQPQLARHIKADPTLRDAILNNIIKKANGMYVPVTRPVLIELSKFYGVS